MRIAEEMENVTPNLIRSVRQNFPRVPMVTTCMILDLCLRQQLRFPRLISNSSSRAASSTPSELRYSIALIFPFIEPIPQEREGKTIFGELGQFGCLDRLGNLLLHIVCNCIGVHIFQP